MNLNKETPLVYNQFPTIGSVSTLEHGTKEEIFRTGD